MKTQLKTRLAPTPSGLLHAGNGLSFLMTWALARAADGSILLRIDDLDNARSRPAYLEDIFRTIAWLGLDYDEGPSGPDDFSQHWSQHQRLDLYEEALSALSRTGFCYACSCSRKQWGSLAEGSAIYPGTCRQLGSSLSSPDTAWRLALSAPTVLRCEAWLGSPKYLDAQALIGDFVVRQKNAHPAYQLASLVDDVHFGINAIVRGEDLIPSTAAQLYLAHLLGWYSFGAVQFWHHGLVRDEKGEKLSKSYSATALQTWREQGRSPIDLYRMAAQWLGLAPEGIEKPAELVAALKRSWG